MNKDVVSMATRIEVTKQLKQAYRSVTRAEKSDILDHFCTSTGVSRVTARRYLTSPHLGIKNVTKIDRRTHRPTESSLLASATTPRKCVLNFSLCLPQRSIDTSQSIARAWS